MQDLSEALENCASDGIKAMYDSYEVSALDSAMIDGRLMALPEPSFVDGPNLLWLRRDWMDKLGLEAPDTIEEAIEIVRAFVEQDPGNNGEGNTIGLVCHSDLTGETGYRYEFQLNTVFASYNAFPKQWILQEDGTVVYGSVQPQAKEALAGVRKLYEEKLLDDSFMLRTMAKELYLEIITGVKDMDAFDRFVEEWMEAGGEQITLEVTEAVQEAKGA